MHASNATLEVDRTDIEKDQTINAVFTFKGKLTSEPDFSPLEEDFTIVSQGLSQSVEIINGNYREQQAWNIVLLARKEGALVIPPIDFNGEKSNAVTLNVAAPKPRTETDLGDLFLETELTPESGGYVQQQHLFIVRIYFRGWLIDGQLSDPQLDNQDVVVQSLGEPRRYSTTRNGERYQVYERRHALFPQASGPLTIGETTFSGRLRLPVGGNRLKSVSTPATSRDVLPVPTEYTGDVWLPAESLSLTEVWPSNSLVFEQGVPITRTIGIDALGLTSAQLPALQIDGNDSVRVYPDQPRSSDQVGEQGVTGTRAMAVALVPQQSGEITLPAIEVEWWDTTVNRQRTARLDGKTLSVLPTAGGGNSNAESGETVVAQRPQLLKNPWFYATLLCAFGWLVTSLMRSGRNGVATEVSATDTHGLRQRFKSACLKNDARACSHLLAEILRSDSGHTTSGQRLSLADSDELNRQRQLLNRCLYGPEDQRDTWAGGSDLWRAFEAADRPDTKPSGSAKGLAELAPSAAA